MNHCECCAQPVESYHTASQTRFYIPVTLKALEGLVDLVEERLLYFGDYPQYWTARELVNG